jgi:hypothetical protein
MAQENFRELLRMYNNFLNSLGDFNFSESDIECFEHELRENIKEKINNINKDFTNHGK